MNIWVMVVHTNEGWRDASDISWVIVSSRQSVVETKWVSLAEITKLQENEDGGRGILCLEDDNQDEKEKDD